MSDIWLPGFERIDAGPDGGAWATTDLPWRGAVHTTEGTSIAGAVGAYRKHNSPPQVTVDIVKRQRAQHIPLNRSAYALKNLPGGVETNRMPLIQIEVVGFASLAWRFTEPDLRWFGQEVLRPIMERIPIGFDTPAFVDERDGYIAHRNAPQRMSFEEWRRFNGWCGHQHVPENDHWDPGRLNLDYSLRCVMLPGGTPSTGDDIMKLKLYKTKDTGPTYPLDGETWAGAGNPNANQVWIVGEHRRPVDSTVDLSELGVTGHVDPVIYPVSLGTLRDFPRLAGS